MTSPARFRKNGCSTTKYCRYLTDSTRSRRSIAPSALIRLTRSGNRMAFSPWSSPVVRQTMKRSPSRYDFRGLYWCAPLSPKQVLAYLAVLGSVGAPVALALREDPSLWDLLDSPLLVNVVTVALAETADSAPEMNGTMHDRRDHLFTSYVNQTLRRRAKYDCLTRVKSIHWLSWLAKQMNDRGQTVFYLEGMQLEWLSKTRMDRRSEYPPDQRTAWSGCVRPPAGRVRCRRSSQRYAFRDYPISGTREGLPFWCSAWSCGSACRSLVYYSECFQRSFYFEGDQVHRIGRVVVVA